jgi:RHS repeat-associated protein
MNLTIHKIAACSPQMLVLLCTAFVFGQGTANADHGAASALKFSAQPSDAELSFARVLDEPLIPLDGPVLMNENQALAAAFEGYANRAVSDDCSSLAQFADAFPNSRWTGPLLAHLGAEYYNYGYYSKALDAWERAWTLCQDVRSGPAKPEADRVLGELARMYSRIGRMSELGNLLHSVKGRNLTGPGTQLIHAAQSALWLMKNRPGFCFRCGPLALDRILMRTAPAKTANAAFDDYRSPTNGFTLPQIAELSRRLDMNYQMAFRSPGASFITPAVIHWKVGHFAAVVEQRDDRFLVQDFTFHGSVWMTAHALEQEASGYFLVPPGGLPKGWRTVSPAEGESVSGKGEDSGNDTDGTSGLYDVVCGGINCIKCACSKVAKLLAGPPAKPDPDEPHELPAGAQIIDGHFTWHGPPAGPPSGTFDYPSPVPSQGSWGGDTGSTSGGMTTYTMHALLASLTLQDTPVAFKSPVGPQVTFTATYNQFEANQPATFYYSNLGPKWDCSWLSYITDNPNSPDADVALYLDGGGTLRFQNFNPLTQSFSLEAMSQTMLVRLTSSSYELQYPDGSRREYATSDGSSGSTRRIFLTQIIDAAGNTVQLNYQLKPQGATNALLITNIVNAIGQAMTLSYTNAAYPFAITSVSDPFGRTAYFDYNTNGLLEQITDVLGLTSQYTYSNNDFISALTTPYGTSTFASGTMDGTTNFYLTATDPMGATEAVLSSQALPVPHSVPASEMPHGLSTFNLFMDARDSFFWDKRAFAEGPWDYRTAHIYHWLHLSPQGIDAARILESEKDPLESRVWYNYPGQYTNLFLNGYTLDAAYTGSNSEPSIVARMLDDGTTQLSAFGYNALGNLTNYTDPLGRNFTYVYASNNVDLIESRMTRNGKNELLGSATYNASHQPLTLTDAAGQTTVLTYNSRGQVLTVTNPKNETATFTYDANGFLLAVTGPLGGTNDTASLNYDAFNRIQSATDTEGYTATFSYDVFDRPTSITYPDGTSEQFIYDRLDLVERKDRLGRWTTNTYDADQRLVSTLDPLGRLIRFNWCKCGLLEAITDPMGRTTSWNYDIQSRPISKQYPDGSMENFAYENSSGRFQSLTDASGQQVMIDYYADNNVKSLTYLNSTNPAPTVNFTYDPDYNRVSTMQDGVGTTVYSYNPITSPPNLGASLLQSVSGPLMNSTVSYQYDQLGRIASRSINGATESAAYDVLNRIVSETNSLGAFQYSFLDATPRLTATSYPTGQADQFAYYDNVGDQRLKQILHLKQDSSLLSSFGYTYNAVGQITTWTNQWDTLPLRVWNLGYDAADQLTAAIRTDGLNPISTNIYAYDEAGNRTLAAADATTNLFSYNALNQIVDGSADLTNGSTYEWDAAHRLTTINNGSRRTEFTYDGLDRLSRIVEKQNGVVISNNTFLWCADTLCEERDSTGATVVKRFFPQGESIIGAGTTNLYYTRDHLGSVREAVDASGTIQARYDYDPYGQQTVLSGNLMPSFGFTGHYQHQPSGLYFALYRVLDPTLGRWLNRDPLGETAGLNLYDYVNNNPTLATDPSGENPVLIGIGLGLIVKSGVQAIGKAYYTYQRQKDIEARLKAIASQKAGLDQCSESFIALNKEESDLRKELYGTGGKLGEAGLEAETAAGKLAGKLK